MANRGKNISKTKINNKNYKLFLCLFVLLIIILLCSLPFGNEIQAYLALRPNLGDIEETSLSVHFVDVGQGDAILVRLPNDKTMIIDTGSSKNEEDLLDYIDNVFFYKSTKKYFDYAILTHSDEDHSGNMLEVMELYEIKNFYRPNIYAKCEEDNKPNNGFLCSTITYNEIITELAKLEDSGQTNVYTSMADVYVEDDEYITFLGPTKENYNDSNAYSSIIMLEYQEHKILLTGDAEYDEIMQAIPSSCDIELLKVGHHGSRVSIADIYNDENDVTMVDTILDDLMPEYAVISVAKVNSYNHPNPYTIEVLENYMLDGQTSLYDNTYMTSNDGTIISYINNEEDMLFLTLGTVGSYAYVDWSYIVIISSSCLAFGVVLILVIFVGTKNKRQKN